MSEPRDYKDNHLSRIYREGAWPEPSRQIDAAILAASRRAARERHSFARRWAPWFAVAAAAVLTSALVLKGYRERHEAVSPPTPDKPTAMRAAEPAPVAEPKAAGAKPAPSPQAVATPRGFSATMDTAEADRLERLQRDLGGKRSLPAGESPKAAPAEKPVSAPKKETPETPRADLLQRAPVRSIETPPPASPISAPASAATQGAAVFGTGIAPAPASVQAQPPVAAPAAAPSAAALAGETAGSVRAAKALVRSPQAWLEDIRKLMAEGKSEETGRELAEFRKRYPDFALPEDLR